MGLFAQMVFVKVDMDVITHSAAISACEKGQQWQLAFGLFTDMVSAKVDKDAITFSAAMGASEKGQQVAAGLGAVV